MFSGGGEYYFTQADPFPCPGGDYDGPLQGVDGDCLPAACDAVVLWAKMQAEAVLRGSALAGRPLQIMTAGTAWEAALQVPLGDADDQALTNPVHRAAFSYGCLVDFGNEINAMVDVHFHFIDFGEAEDVAADMKNPPPSTNLASPDFITSLEYGPTPSKTWWDDEERGQQTHDFFDGDSTLPDEIVDWDEIPTPSGDEWITRWMNPLDVKYGDVFADFPNDFLTTGFNTLSGLGYRTVCYGPTRQVGSTAGRFWLGAIHASALVDVPPGFTRWKQRFESAASYHAGLLQPWSPHPSPCDWVCADCP